MLTASLRAGLDFVHACGGRGSCSTCRVLVVKGWESCAERTAKELAISERLRFGPEFRLACQTRVTGDVTIRRLVLDERDEELADLRQPSRRRRHRVRSRRSGRDAVADPRPIGEELPVAAMFADIRGFSAFAETVLPYDVIHVLQRQLRDVTNAVERHRGVVTSYMGDGVMALFLEDGSDPAARRAVHAGLQILDETDHRRHALDELYGRSFDMNVGVHFGMAIVGRLWGTPATTTTAIGDTVNLASRIEQANKELGTRLLVSDAARGEVGDGVAFGRSFRCPLPGRAGEHDLHEVLGFSSPRVSQKWLTRRRGMATSAPPAIGEHAVRLLGPPAAGRRVVVR